MMEAFEYIIKDTDHSFRVGLGAYGLMEIFYKHPKCQTPVTKEKAEELANTFKAMIESAYPLDSLNKEDFEQSKFGKFLEKMMDDDDCDDDCGCSSPTASDLFGMMLMASLMKD